VSLAAAGRCLSGPDQLLHDVVYGGLAVAGLDRIIANGVESRSRGTRVFERRNGQWQMVHQHLSIPVTGE